MRHRGRGYDEYRDAFQSHPQIINTINLDGIWRFQLDPKHIGLQGKWFASRLPDEIHLPGTTDEAKIGLPNPAKPSLDGLYRPNIYAGPAWYQRDIEVPESWSKGHYRMRVQLFLNESIGNRASGLTAAR